MAEGVNGSQLADRAPVAIGDLRLLPPLLRLRGPTGESEVEPLVMRFLLVLAEEPGRVLAREALLGRCWPDTTVGDDSLHRVVAAARRGMRETGTHTQIETIPRTGYRLVAAVGDVHETALEGAGSAAGEGRAEYPLVKRRALLVAGGGMVLAGGAALLLARRPAPVRTAEVVALVAAGRAALRAAEPDSEQQGVRALQAAVRAAPDDAEAWGLLATALRAVAEFSAPNKVAPAMAAAEAAARRALAIDAGQPDARAVLVMLEPLHGNWKRAERGFKQILADAPDHLPSLDGLSQVQASAGLVREHYPARKRTVELDPLHAGYNFRSIYAHWMNGELAAADRAGARGIELWPRHLATWSARAGLFLFSGRPERTLVMLDDAAMKPSMPSILGSLFGVVAQAQAAGDDRSRERAVAVLDQVVNQAGPFLAVTGSMLLAGLSEPAKALAVAEAFLLERGSVMVNPVWRPGELLHNDVRRRFTNFLFTPVMAEVRSLPGFAAMMSDIGLTAFWEATGRVPDYQRK